MTALPLGDLPQAVSHSGRTSGSKLPADAPDFHLGAGGLAIFTGPGFPVAALGLPLVVSLPEFYANYVGVKLAVVGLVFMLIRLVDLAVDPFLGAMMDVTRTRLGRFRPWMIAGSPVLMVATYMTFMAAPGAGALYMAGWLLALYLGYSILVLSHAAWASTLASGYNARSRIYSWVQNAAVLGMVLVLFLPPIVGPMFPANHAAGVQAMGWFIILLTPITVALAVWRTPEPAPLQQVRPRLDLKTFLSLARRPAVSKILIADICLAMAPAISGALFIFFFREARGFTTTQTTLLLLIYFLGGLAGAPLWTWLARRIGKHRALIAAALHFSVMMSLTLILPKGAFALTAPFFFITGLAFSAATIMLRAMLADAADEAEYDRGDNRTGILFAMITTTSKIGNAVAVGLSFPILQAVGFVPRAGAHNTPSALLGLELLFVVAPVVFSLIAALALRGYHLDEKTHREICAMLKARTA